MVVLPNRILPATDSAGRRWRKIHVGRTTRMGVEQYQDYTLYINDDRVGCVDDGFLTSNSALIGSTSFRTLSDLTRSTSRAYAATTLREQCEQPGAELLTAFGMPPASSLGGGSSTQF